MTNVEELARLDGLAQAELVRAKQVKSVELVEAAIERIQYVNPSINAVVTQMFEQAIALARDDRRLPDGPFRGVPYLLKDILSACAGVPLTSGCSFLRGYVPGHDSELVCRLKRAGLIILGKTNTPELGLVATTEPRLFGATRNPWNTERMAGGSSGGSCAAVASGMVPMAHASDGGGSIRIPASCCGIFGLKPTRARITLAPDIGDVMGGMVVEHAVTRSVRDSAALLDATAGPALGDPYCAPQPPRPFLKEASADPGRLRIAFTTCAATGAPVDPDCVQATENAAKLCASLGHDVVEDGPKLDGQELFRTFMTIWAAGCAASIDGWAYTMRQTPTEDQFEPLTWSLYQIGTRVSASAYMLCQAVLQRVSRQIACFMANYDVVLTPTLAQPPLPLGSFSSPPLDPLEVQQRLAAFTPFTQIANITGQPAMSIPLYWTAGDLPIGTQFVARFGDEATLFRLAAQLESAKPWASRWPPVSAFA
jgi:amidase